MSVLAACVCGSATAQVLEIRDDGSVVAYAGPSVHTDAGVQPISPVWTAAPQANSADVSRYIEESAARHDVPAQVVRAVAWQESRFDSRAVSPKGARGVMQLMPQTARELGVDVADVRSNIDGGAAYLASQLRRFGDLRLALAAYNAGPAAVLRYGDVPPFAETQNYVRAILARLSMAAGPSAAAE